MSNAHAFSVRCATFAPCIGWRGILSFVAVLCALLAPLSAAELTKESDVKAALLYNFTQFAEWPPSAFEGADDPFVIGIMGRDPLGGVLDKLVEHEAVAGHRIVVTRYRNVEAARQAHVLYISASERAELSHILPALAGHPVLTVADFDGFLDRGGMVVLQRGRNQKIRIRVNLAAAQAASLTFSAKLLRVVEIVSPEEEP
ncbi:MAG TPA: YfiR family protein [Opitutus sp.]|nr:YfiR family protein [Opitutus sp.]